MPPGALLNHRGGRGRGLVAGGYDPQLAKAAAIAVPLRQLVARGDNRFDPLFAGDIRRQRVSAMRGFRHWRWHLHGMDVKPNGEMVYLWRAVGQEGEVLKSYITRTRDKAAALAG